MWNFKAMVVKDFGIKHKPITTYNPQANAIIIERTHQTIENNIRSFQVQNLELDLDDPWSDILATTMFVINNAIHTTIQATPSQLVIGRDAILNIGYETNWQLINKESTS